MLTHLETGRRSRQAPPEVADFVVGYGGSRESDERHAVAAKRAELQVIVVGLPAATFVPALLGVR